ncbi:MAG: hypothetical protein ACSLFC_08390 [Desulfuromonadales bacterium]
MSSKIIAPDEKPKQRDPDFIKAASRDTGLRQPGGCWSSSMAR